MHPNTYLKTFWRLTLKPQVFVAMSFAPQYQKRFDEVITPAIQSIQVGGVQLEPYRVDLSKSGDSILTEINDGIAHSRMILADVSTIGRDAITGDPIRNANVLYEVGIALACRLPHEVLLVRDDSDKFLFDISTIPHKRLDFTNVPKAREEIVEALVQRLHEANQLHDARVQIALASLSGAEIEILKGFESSRRYNIGFENRSVQSTTTIPRLLDKNVIRLIAYHARGFPLYELTDLGYIIASKLDQAFPIVGEDQIIETSSEQISSQGT